MHHHTASQVEIIGNRRIVGNKNISDRHEVFNVRIVRDIFYPWEIFLFGFRHMVRTYQNPSPGCFRETLRIWRGLATAECDRPDQQCAKSIRYQETRSSAFKSSHFLISTSRGESYGIVENFEAALQQEYTFSYPELARRRRGLLRLRRRQPAVGRFALA